MSKPVLIALSKGETVPGWQEPSPPSSTIDVVVNGRIGVFTRRRDERLRYIVDPGGIIAIPEAEDPPDGRHIVRALTGATVARFDRADLQAALGREPLLASFFQHLRVYARTHEEEAAGTVVERVARQLDAFAEGRGSFTLPVTQEELGRLVGASRERVNKALHRLVEEGMVAYNGRQFRILARDGLQRVSSGDA